MTNNNRNANLIIHSPSTFLLRLLAVLTFQSRISIITTTLVAAFSDLVHLLGLTIMVTVMFATASFVISGPSNENSATFNDAMYRVFVGMIDPSGWTKVRLSLELIERWIDRTSI